MIVRVRTSGKVSKAKGTSSAVAVIDGLPEGPVEVGYRQAPGDGSPTVAQVRGAALGVAVAIHKGATRVELETPSKGVARAVLAEPGGGIDDLDGARLAAWAIYWTRDRLPGGFSVTVAKHEDVEAMAKARLA